MRSANASFLTVNGVAELLDLNPATVRRMISRGELLSVKVAGRYRVPAESVLSYLVTHWNVQDDDTQVIV